MQTYTNLQETILQLFVEIDLQISKPLRTMLASLIVCLLENSKAHISRLGECLEVNSDANVMGCMQRIRRFLSSKRISPAMTVLPLICLMRPLRSNLPEIVLAMDRTDWEKRKKYINILTVAISYKGRACPIYWKVSGRKGSKTMVVATTLNDAQESDKLYGQRFGIEAMHKDWKSNAFELEKTRVTDPNRIETLLIPIAFAYILCVLEGEKRARTGDVRSPPRGKTRTTGLFLNGLRNISNHLRRTTLETFVIFIRNLLNRSTIAWKIPAFA